MEVHMDMDPFRHENTNIQNFAIPPANHTSLLRSTLSNSSQSRTFSTQSRKRLPPLPSPQLAGNFRENCAVLPARCILTHADIGQDPSFNALDSLLHEMESGKEAEYLNAPHEYHSSMISLADQSLIPTSVSLRKLPDAKVMASMEEQLSSRVFDLNSLQSMILPLSQRSRSAVQHDDAASHHSDGSSSVYSEHSSTAASPRKGVARRASRLGNTTTSPHSGATALHAFPIETQSPSVSPVVFTPKPIHSRKCLTEDSVTCQTQDLLSEDISSGPTVPSSSYTNQKGDTQENKQQTLLDTSSELGSSAGSFEDFAEAKRAQVATQDLNEKAARLLGLSQQNPKSTSPVTPTASHFARARHNSDERSWTSSRILKNMVSKMSLSTPKKSPLLVNFPTNEGNYKPLQHEIGSPSSHTESLYTRKNMLGLERARHSEKKNQSLFGVAEESMSSLVENEGSDNSVGSAASLSRRRGFRPLSVRVGEVFNPFSSKTHKPDILKLSQKLTSSDEDISSDLSRGPDLADKINRSENLDSRLFNANFVAPLTSKTLLDIKHHPAMKADPFSEHYSEPSLRHSVPSKHAIGPPVSSYLRSASESQKSSSNSQGGEKIVIGLQLADLQEMLSLRSALAEPVHGGDQTSSPKSDGQSSSPKSGGQGSSTNSDVSRHHLETSPSSPTIPRPGSGSNRPAWKWKSPLQHNFGARKYSGLPPSPSVSTYDSRAFHRKNPTPPSLPTPSSFFLDEAAEGKRIRGLTNLFKPRSGSKNSNKGVGNLAEVGKRRGSAELDRLEQIKRLRTKLSAQSYDHDLADVQPRHPTTGRGWHSRNLRCTSCASAMCPCCGRACCSFRACIMAAENKLTPAQIREAALSDLASIIRCFPVGQESPTFIQCTHESGCGRLICPDCCGMCPDECCQDVQCRKCKSHPWAKCDWHPDSDAKIKDAVQRNNPVPQA